MFAHVQASNITVATTINQVVAAQPAGQVVVGQIPQLPRCFVHRAELTELRAVLHRSRVPVAVTGMRGVGKTQLAAALARDGIDTGTALVGWIDGESMETACAGLAEIAERLGVADPEGDSAVSARRLRDCLAGRRDSGLLVFDNAVDPDVIRSLLPTGGGTRLLITSTNRDFAALGEPVDLSTYTRQESVRFLAEATGRTDVAAADLVAAALGDLPLALSVAAATIVGRRIDYARYQELLAERSLPNILERKAGHDYPLSVVQAILLSVDIVETCIEDPDRNAVTCWLLAVMSMLSPAGVRRSILPDLGGRLDEGLERCVTGSLLSWSTSGDTVIMHRLVARVLRERAQSDGVSGDLVTAALKVVGPWLVDRSQAWAHRERGFHVVDQIDAIWNTGLPEATGGDLLQRVFMTRKWAVVQLTEAADIARASALGQDFLNDCERLLGPLHPATLVSRDSLAHVHESAGRLGEAIPLYESALADCERVFGTDHLATLMSRNNLACAYTSAEQPAKAIPLHETTLTDYERIFGPDYPHILTSRNNLACAYRSAGRLDKVIPLLETNLVECERVVGPNHSATLTCRNDLAAAYLSARQLDKAIPLLDATLAARERELGADHPDTLLSCGNLASAYQAAGQFDRAKPLFAATLAARERVLGPDHPDTLLSRGNLASAYQAAGQFDRAKPLFAATLAARERVLGPDHPDTLISRNNLAGVYESAGQLDKATFLFEATLAARERVLGPDHPDTLSSRNNLAAVYGSSGRLDRAISLFETTLTDRERVLGTDHPDTLSSRNNLASIYQLAEQSDRARSLFEATRTDCERVLGTDHQLTVGVRNNLHTPGITVSETVPGET